MAPSGYPTVDRIIVIATYASITQTQMFYFICGLIITI